MLKNFFLLALFFISCKGNSENKVVSLKNQLKKINYKNREIFIFKSKNEEVIKLMLNDKIINETNIKDVEKSYKELIVKAQQ